MRVGTNRLHFQFNLIQFYLNTNKSQEQLPQGTFHCKVKVNNNTSATTGWEYIFQSITLLRVNDFQNLLYFSGTENRVFEALA